MQGHEQVNGEKYLKMSSKITKKLIENDRLFIKSPYDKKKGCNGLAQQDLKHNWA
jgi:hypothetical protein